MVIIMHMVYVMTLAEPDCCKLNMVINYCEEI